MADDIWEYYAKDMMFESHKEPHYITQQYITYLETQVAKLRKVIAACRVALDCRNPDCDCKVAAIKAYDEFARGE